MVYQDNLLKYVVVCHLLSNKTNTDPVSSNHYHFFIFCDRENEASHGVLPDLLMELNGMNEVHSATDSSCSCAVKEEEPYFNNYIEACEYNEKKYTTL